VKEAAIILPNANSVEQQSSYRQIMKATSIFGGVQFFNIIISIIRTKLIAVLLGPSGMGIAALLNSTTGMITNITNFGLGTSAIKDIAAANTSDNKKRISTIVTVFRKLVWFTGTIGFAVTLVLSPWLSDLTFGNRNYTFAFALLSITLLLGQLSVGQMVVLQGMRKMQHLAKANIFGSALGLLCTFPLYYLYKIDAIVPAIIITSIITLSLSWFFSRKIKMDRINVSMKETVFEGKSMLTMGFMINLSILITFGVSYILRLFISRTGGIEQVGLYNSGFSIINMYVAMIFTAMATDYYPRLSAVAENNFQCKKAINQQAEIALLILAPIILVFLVFIQWVVVILYSKSFLGINGMIHWAVLGIFFKAASWSIAFILLAKGASKLFFWSELFANTYQLLFNLIGYKFWGLDGLGVSYMLGYIIYLIQVFIIARMRYEFAFEKQFYQIFCIQFILGIICFEITRISTSYWVFFVGAILIFCSTVYSYKELDKRIGIKELILGIMKKVKK
jgi:O-antigen/teichoic acid export membrane protein